MPKRTSLQLWDLWYSKAGSTGMSFARGRLAATDILLVHAPPPSLTVEIRSDKGRRLAYSQDLAQTADRPMAILTRGGDQVARQDRWPTKEDIGQLVLLPGGEVGVLVQWWNAEDGSEWRWQVEFYNHR
jgi:hypothetical protein